MKRTLGETIPISIGTAVPIETLISERIKFASYTSVYINVRTLFRNFLASYEKEPDANKDMFQEFVSDVDMIISVFNNLPQKLYLYYPSYKSLSSIFPKANLKKAKTKKQLDYVHYELMALKYLLESELKPMINLFDVKIQAKREKSLIITSYPVDLLSYKNFEVLTLLESHTGHTKSKVTWISKLTSNEAYQLLPFNGITMQIIGDKSNLFNSLDRGYVIGYLRISEKGLWSPTTTEEKIKFDISNDSDRFLVVNLKQLYPHPLK
jgi:hypothetical protein